MTGLTQKQVDHLQRNQHLWSEVLRGTQQQPSASQAPDEQPRFLFGRGCTVHGQVIPSCHAPRMANPATDHFVATRYDE